MSRCFNELRFPLLILSYWAFSALNLKAVSYFNIYFHLYTSFSITLNKRRISTIPYTIVFGEEIPPSPMVRFHTTI